MEEKTATEIYMRAHYGETRGRAAAHSLGWRTPQELAAFTDGARWMLEQLGRHCDIKPKAP